MRELIVILLWVICSANYAQQTDYVDFEHASIDLFNVHPESKEIGGAFTYTFKILKDVDSIYINANSFYHMSIMLDSVLLDPDKIDNKIIIRNKFKANTSHVLHGNWVTSPKKALYFVGWDNGAPNQIWTQGQGKYTSNWMPSFDDMNEKVEFDFTITFNNAYDVIANGTLLKKDVGENTTKWYYDMNNPMPSYLAAIVIGKYEKKVEYANSGVPLEFYYYTKDSLKVEPTYRYSKEIFDFFETEIGVPYPWQNYKQVPVHDFLYAGMENTSLTIFSDDFMIDDTAFVDKNYVNVNAHELAHQWFGNYVTAKSGEHHWLQEGFATYYALLAEQMVFGEDYYYWKLYESAHQLLDQNNSKTSTSLLNPKSSSLTFYQRGAWVLHALKSKVGAEIFKEAVINYLNKHKYSNVQTDDFFAEVESASKVDLSAFKTLWLEGTLFPFDEAMGLLRKSIFIQEYEMVDCELINAKCDYYLTSQVSDQAKSKIIAQIPNRINTKVFNNSIKARQAIAKNLTQIPLSLKENYESLLKDPSYITIESALYNLWVNFPNDRASFLEKTKDKTGFSDRNLRQLWLVLALSTPNYDDKKKQIYFDELEAYTSANYGFSVRQNAFSYLNSMQVFTENSIRNLIDASQHHNWRFKSFSKKLLESMSEKEEYKTIILKLGIEQN